MKNTTLMAQIWADLSLINVNDNVQKKGNLSYLSWAWAWSTLMERYPESYYRFEDSARNDGSVMVECVVTIHEGEEVACRTMWLPVMDNRNNAILHPTARDVSDTRMRCLVKALAMFGLGFYIYAGEDIPSAEKEAQAEPIGKEKAETLSGMIKETGSDLKRLLKFYSIDSLEGMSGIHYEQAFSMLQSKIYAQNAAAEEAVPDVDL